MGFWLTVDSNKTLQRKSCVLAAVAGLGEFLFAEEQSSFSGAFESLIACNFALLHDNEKNTTVVVVWDMELVCGCPTLNCPEQAFLKKEVLCTQIMVLLSSLQKVATPTLPPRLPRVSVSEIIKQIVSKFVSDMRCRSKAGVELCTLANKHAPCHGLLDRFEWLEEGQFPKGTVDYQFIIVDLFHNIIDLCRQVILHTECLTFFTSPVLSALGHILSIRA